MELARLYPGWITAVVATPQEWIQTRRATPLLWALRRGVLHNGYLFDLFGTDYPIAPIRSQITWVVTSYTRLTRWHIQGWSAVTPSVVGLWPSATWFEREAWEMLGITFVGHPDLRRLLTDYGFVGYPLRKDFPVGGYLELRYSEKHKRVTARAVTTVQEFRVFDFVSPWQS
jgi:NADH-quinone oxidoreductase subunit C